MWLVQLDTRRPNSRVGVYKLSKPQHEQETVRLE